MNEPVALPPPAVPAPPPADPLKAILFPRGWPQRLWFLWATAVWPAALFPTAIFALRLAEWQKPGPQVHLQLLVQQSGAVAFLPLAAAIALVCAVIALRPGAWVFGGVCRAALFIGLLLAVHYAFLLPAAMLIESSWPALATAFKEWGGVLLLVFGIEAVSVGLVVLVRFLVRRWGWPLTGFALLFLLTSGVVLAWAPWGDDPSSLMVVQGSLAAAFLGLCLFAGPIWTADALARLLWRMGRPATWPYLPLAFGLLAYVASWRWALVRAAEAFAALPPEPPNCFVATAAARAPIGLTRGFTARAIDGRAFRATAQLQRFKLFELALRELSPRGHRILRRIYDRIGPALAARIGTPARAAMAWLALKPLEALAVLLLWLAGGARLLGQAALLYRSAAHGTVTKAAETGPQLPARSRARR